MPDVLVIGGGFAGLAAVNALARNRTRKDRVTVRLVDSSPWSVFAPVLPDLISRRLRPESMRYAIEPHCRRRGVEFIQAKVTAILPGENAVETDRGVLRADYFILCLGCGVNFFGNRQAEEHAIGLRAIEDGLRISGGIEQALRGKDKPQVLVVGGGYTGFEAASHAAHLIHRLTGLPYRRVGEVCPVTLLERSDQVLRNVSPFVREWAMGVIDDFGVVVRTGVTVESFAPEGARLSDGSLAHGALVIWSPGVAPGEAVARLEAPKVAGGRLKVDEYLRLTGRDNLFSAGDVAGATRPGESAPLRMGIQFSLAGGARAAENVLRTIRRKPLRPFTPFDPGYILPLAPGRGAGVILGRELHGRLPIALHYFMSLLRSWSWRNRWEMGRDLAVGRGKNDTTDAH